MSDSSAHPARPVSLFTIVFLLVLFAAFLLVVRYFYEPSQTSPQNLAAENMPKELEWRATPESRRKALADQREAEAKQTSTYGWTDQAAGKVQLPIDRAMELTAKQHGARK
jgi:hypothetical protein